MNVRSYHRPDTMEAALTLLESDGTAVLAGGTMLNRRPTEHPQAVVDLQALGLDQPAPVVLGQQAASRGAGVVVLQSPLQRLDDVG